MAQFVAFPGVLYNDPDSEVDDGVLDINSVMQESSSSPFAVRRLLEDPSVAADWLRMGHLRFDEPALYLCRMGWHTNEGQPVQQAGVFGLWVAEPEAPLAARPAFVPSALRVPVTEFDLLLQPEGLPLVHATTEQGHFRLWAIRQPGVIALIVDVVAALERPEDHVLPVLGFATTGEVTPPPGLVFHLPPPASH